MEKGEILEENRKVKGEKNRKERKIEAVLLLCLPLSFNLSGLGGPNRSKKLQPE